MPSVVLLITIILIVCIVAIASKIHKAVRQHFRIRRALQQFPSHEPHWLFGNILHLGKPNEARIKLMMHHANLFKTSYVYWFSIFPILMCTHHQVARAVIKANVPKGSWIYGWARPWLGQGLILANGSKWARNRRLLTPAFHFDVLKTYVSVYNECADVLLSKWIINSKTGEFFDEYQDIKLLSFDVILQCSFSLKIDCQTTGKNHLYLQAVKDLSHSIIDRATYLPHYIECIYRLSSNGKRFRKLCDYVHRFAEDIIIARQQELNSANHSELQSKKHLDFVDILITARDEDGKGLSVTEIREEADNVMFAGHDTTSSALSWTLYCLAKYPQHQDKVRKEIDEVVGDKNDVEWQDLSRLTYTQMCIKEAIRINTTVPTVERRAETDMEIDGKFVPAGTMLRIHLFTLCHRDDAWTDPDFYDPERFSVENCQKRDPYDFIPFSAGPRNCIGQNFAMNEMKVVVAKVIRKFQLEIDEKRPAVRYLAVVNQPEHGMWIKAKLRCS